MLPREEMFPGRGCHSSVLYLGFHNCFYSDRVLGIFFSTTNKEARGWVWEGNYSNRNNIHPWAETLGERWMGAKHLKPVLYLLAEPLTTFHVLDLASP